MCNAWNHPAGCTCGWGGDTGGGGWQDVASPVRHVPFVDGRCWSRLRNPTYDTYTIPNAKCPVCGARVYFYQSPFGGRVFFDELGPPWPKHPCTDNYFRSTRTPIVPPADPAPARSLPPPWDKDGWIPLIVGSVKTEGGVSVIPCVEAKSAIRHSFGLRGGQSVNFDGPLFCRRLADGTGRFELAYVRDGLSGADLTPGTAVVCPKVRDSEGMTQWEEALAGDAEAENYIGMRLSFSMDSEFARKAGIFPSRCDWDAAERWFRKAADKGHWAGLNNIGVMRMNGYGKPRDDWDAFELLSKAAESMQPNPLRHLAVCYDEGRGVRPDHQMAAHLRELADLAEAESGEEEGQ